MSDVRDRNLLYARLEEVLGAEPAGILMRQLTPHDEILTKSDLRQFETTVTGRIDGLEMRMDGLEMRMDRLETHMERFDDRLDGFHAALHQQTRNFILWTSAVMASFSTVIVASGILT